MEPGDILYAKRGRNEIIGRGEVLSDARFIESETKFRNVRNVSWTHQGSWEPPESTPLKTLTNITAKTGTIEELEDLIAGGSEPEAVETSQLPSYKRHDFLHEVFMGEERYDRLVSLVRRKKNVILAGPPGVGKTFAAKRLAYSMMGEKDPSRVQLIQFHQSYSYEDFMMGYRPTKDGEFRLEFGPFYDSCELARLDEERPYFFIIDEINRGNISRIFGELLMLIENDKRGQQLRLLYKKEDFSVPKNVHIIGMMNTADRSLATLDYALRRRFGFFELAPAFDSAGFASRVEETESSGLINLITTIKELNSAIRSDEALGKGFEIGHSYLVPSTAASEDDSWLDSVVNDELIPLLEEYWFDSPDQVATWTIKLRAAIQ